MPSCEMQEKNAMSVNYGKPVIKVVNYNCLSSSQVNFDTTGDIKRKEKGKRKGKERHGKDCDVP